MEDIGSIIADCEMTNNVDELALVLLEAWSKAEPDHIITKHPHSYIATFADMAMAAIEYMDKGVVEFAHDEKRPVNCRNRLRDEGKPYPKSGCNSCSFGGMTGCPHERSNDGVK